MMPSGDVNLKHSSDYLRGGLGVVEAQCINRQKHVNKFRLHFTNIFYYLSSPQVINGKHTAL